MTDAYRQGLKHRVVIIFVEEQGTGRLLLQRRSPKVAVYANVWDVAAAGHVDLGEDYLEAAKRELKEELGLEDYALTQIDHLYTETSFTDGRQANRFRRVYKTIIPDGVALQPAPDEVSELRWFLLPELRRFIAENPAEVHDDLGNLVMRLFPA